MSYQFELRQLQSFLVLSKELHFRKAAEKLYISQPGLSKQIQQLEKELSIRLIERDNRNVRLTPAGAYLSTQVEVLQGLLDHSVRRIKQIDAGIIGDIRIGFVGSAMQSIIPDLIQQSYISIPEIHFQLDEMSNQAQIDALQRYTIELGFVRLNSVPEGLQIKPVFTEHFSLVVPKNHSIGEKSFKSMKQFKDESFILFSSDYSSTYYSKIMSIFADASFTPKVSHKSIHANSIFRLVESGFGVAIVPHSLTKGAALSIGIKVIELKKIRQQAILSVCWNKENLSQTVETILDILNDLKPNK